MVLNNIELFSPNIKLFYLINHTRHPFLDAFYSYFYLLGKGYILLPLLIFVYLFRRDSLRLLLLSLSFETFVVYVLKKLFHIPRPASTFGNVYILEPLYRDSFPSGDTALAFLVAAFLTPLVPLFMRPLLWLYPLLIAYGRVYLGVHYPLDVLAGALIGILSCTFAKGILKEK